MKDFGVPIMKVHVLADGTVGGATLVKSCGCPAADKLLLESVNTWRYKPAIEDGRPVDRTITVTPADYP